MLTDLWTGCTLFLWLCGNPELSGRGSSYLALEGSADSLPNLPDAIQLVRDGPC